MPKPDRETLLRQGEELLQSWGVAADAAPAALAACVGRQPAADVAIAERLGRMAEDASVEPLRRLESESSDKLVRKDGLLERDVTVVDLRLPDRLILRTVREVAPPPPKGARGAGRPT